jgi:tetratricopeptide (TPR) repeat protein
VYGYDQKAFALQEIEDDVIGRIAATIADNSGVMPRRLLDEEKAGSIASSAVTKAILRYYHATSFPTPENTTTALQALSEAHQRFSNHVTILAMLADMHAQAFLLGVYDEPKLTQVEKMARQAIPLDDKCQLAHWVMGWVYFLRFQAEPCVRELDIALSLNSNYAIVLFASAYMLAMIGDWDRGISLIKKALHLNPHYSGHSRFVFFLNHYRNGDFEDAWREALYINTPDFFIDPLSRASVLRQLGRKDEASAALDELVELIPDFHLKGKKQLRLFVFSENNVDILWEGLVNECRYAVSISLDTYP